MRPRVSRSTWLPVVSLSSYSSNWFSLLSSSRPSDTKGGYLDCGFNTTTVSTTKNNLLVNMPEKSDPHKTPTKTSIAMTKNSTGVPTPSSMLNKCKRIYL